MMVAIILAAPIAPVAAQTATQTNEQRIAELMQMVVLLQKQLEILLAQKANQTVVNAEVVSNVQEDVKKQSEALTVILNDINKITNNKKTARDQAISSCKQAYDYEVKRIESMWESDLRFYESRKNSQYSLMVSGLYEMTGTTNKNNQYLEEDYSAAMSRRDSGLSSAKSKYDSCTNRVKTNTSFDKDIHNIAADQKYLIRRLTDNNARTSLVEMNNLIQKAEKIKWSLVLDL